MTDSDDRVSRLGMYRIALPGNQCRRSQLDDICWRLSLTAGVHGGGMCTVQKPRLFSRLVLRQAPGSMRVRSWTKRTSGDGTSDVAAAHICLRSFFLTLTAFYRCTDDGHRLVGVCEGQGRCRGKVYDECGLGFPMRRQ